MDERLTWEEIEKRYPNQWVGLTDVDWIAETGGCTYSPRGLTKKNITAANIRRRI